MGRKMYAITAGGRNAWASQWIHVCGSAPLFQFDTRNARVGSNDLHYRALRARVTRCNARRINQSDETKKSANKTPAQIKLFNTPVQF
jgi:hypothetical protein